MNRVFIITQNDLVYYPPLQTLLMVFLKMRIKVTFIGCFSDHDAKVEYEKSGVVFEDITLNERGNFIQKLLRRKRYSKEIDRYLKESLVTDKDIIWYVYSGATVCSLYRILEEYNYIVHFYEFFKSIHSWRYRVLYPSYNLSSFLRHAKGVIHCEYNRAQICRCLYGLDSMPYIIPNKPYIDERKLQNVPNDISKMLFDLCDKLKGKRVIIYQGYFNAKERRLEEFCQAVDLLSDDYMLIIMGKGGSYFDHLKHEYESERIIFVPFVRPPYHLLVTQKASIGVLTYHPQQNTYAGVINPLYCAPNKIYEYGKYGIPMIGNDIPGLKYVFEKYNCGKTLSYPITPSNIANCIESIFANYGKFSSGSKNLYESVNIEETICNIIKSVEE